MEAGTDVGSSPDPGTGGGAERVSWPGERRRVGAPLLVQARRRVLITWPADAGGGWSAGKSVTQKLALCFQDVNVLALMFQEGVGGLVVKLR